MEEFLSFRKMITPVIIQILFWIGAVLTFLSGLIGMFAGMGFIRGLLVMVLGPIFVRVYCEILIVIFKMNDSLSEIRSAVGKK